MKRSMAMIAAVAACVLSTAAPAAAVTLNVNCNAPGRTIGAALANPLGRSTPLVLRIRGTCSENITIDRDDVTLEEGLAGATILGGIIIDNARRVVVADLTITGSPTSPAADGILVTNGSSATIRSNIITGHQFYGILVQHGSFARVEQNQVRNNGLFISDGDGGIGVRLNSNVRALENTIEDNFVSGLQVFDSSSYRSEGDTIKMSTATPPPGVIFDAVNIFRGGGYADLRRVTVSGQVSVQEQSQLQFRSAVLNNITVNSTVGGNISVGRLSYFRQRGTTLVGSVTISNLSIAQSDVNFSCFNGNVSPPVLFLPPPLPAPQIVTFCKVQ